jgi:signal transduction histidine kinase
VFLVLLITSVLLRQLRVEFDARLEAMSAAIRETDLARQQAEVDRERAEQADKAKSQFLANMSHELRTPLNAIIGYAEAMLAGMAGEFQPKQLELLGYVQTNGRRLLALINDILDLAKIESGKTELYLAPMSPRVVIGDTVASLRSLAMEKTLELRVDYAADLPGVIMGDAKKVEQVLVNLVSNAIKFTDSGAVTVTVVSAGAERWQFSVHDTGIGISPDAQATIFDPFHQVDNSPTRKYKGTGLGLSITKHLVERMGGVITLSSTPGEGTTFTVVLPVFIGPKTTQPLGINPADAKA